MTLWHGATIAMRGFRALAYIFLASAAAWVAAYRGPWYLGHVFAKKNRAFEFSRGDYDVSGSKARVLVFFVAPIVLAAFCGACWEATWIAYHLKRVRGDVPRDTSGNAATAKRRNPSPVWTLLHFNFRPFGCCSPWVTVGETVSLTLYASVMLVMVWQGVFRKMEAHYGDTTTCSGDPSALCYVGTEDHATSSSLVMLENIAKYMGFVAAIQFSLVLVPVSRDSKIWSAIGVPFERAVLYHTALGHLSFASLFLHGFLYMLYYVLKHGWDYAVHSALHYKGHGVNVPAGVVAGAFALPIWITSVQYVRRRYYRVFKTSHFLVIGVFAAAVVHYDGFVYYLLAGFTLYLAHVVSRLGNWNWWNVWYRRVRSSPARGCSSLVHLHTGAEYTRLVLRNPGNVLAKGGMFVYISAPTLLGTLEAHPMSVALRGAPPCLWDTICDDEGVFTLYVKAVGSWTRALHKDGSSNLLVDVDGFYSSVSTFVSMREEGYQRVVLFAGGSGITSFLALIQDWYESNADREEVPEVRVVWSCRSVAEIELLGEALPSFASATANANARLTMSVYCSKKDFDGPLSVLWPIVKKTERSGLLRGNTAYAVFESLDSGIRTLIAGIGALVGWLWAENLADGALLKGVAVIALMAIVPAGMLVGYGWATKLVFGMFFAKTKLCASRRKRYISVRHTSDVGDTESIIGADSADCASKTLLVNPGRAPVHAVLMAEQAEAKRAGIDRVKVLVSGPSGMVDTVMTDARDINWKMFDVETKSREF